ncbi:hypothetical protein [Arthrobacter sp. JCM 19049]|uniref:hypothetical protein n=1 Tax=Arthrobacter sp. JCM 19049 TaxID=1460643 RepID=UPI002436973C|nr:hypothetical protein [Arthrobacter sp. JCM 19049]
MEELFFNLFSQLPGTQSGTQVALFSLSALLSVIACLLLAHRNDLAGGHRCSRSSPGRWSLPCSTT